MFRLGHREFVVDPFQIGILVLELILSDWNCSVYVPERDPTVRPAMNRPMAIWYQACMAVIWIVLPT